MSAFLALLSAASFGAGDFMGGLATRRSGVATTVVMWGHVLGLALLAALVPLFATDAAGEDLAWGAAAGVVGAIGLVLLFRGFALGRMSVVAPITALGAAVVPVVFGLVTGERPPALAIVGSAVALVAIVLVSREEDVTVAETPAQASGLVESLVAGVAFGVFFILVAETSSDSGLIPLVSARAASVTVLVAVTVVLRRRVRIDRTTTAFVVGSGVLDAVANALFLGAVRLGLLSIAAVLSSLYPAGTILLARTLLGERLTRGQVWGLAAGAVGVTMITLG